MSRRHNKRAERYSHSRVTNPYDKVRRLLLPSIEFPRLSSRPVDRLRPVRSRFRPIPERLRRLPILGLRSQGVKVNLSHMVPLYHQVLQIKNITKKIVGTKSICQKRAERKQVLFARKVAGLERRRSPGRGGHYKRREESMLSC